MEGAKNNFQIETEAIQEAIQQELLENTILAVDFGLLPKRITEFEFTVEGKHAIAIEYWPTFKREPSKRVTVQIPTEYQSKFMFPHAAERHHSRDRNQKKSTYY